jgi:hypothetical protein
VGSGGRDAPVAAADWRDRQLLALPATARLVGVTLADAATGRSLRSWSEGAPAIAPLAASWRQLRAAGFGPGDFSAAGGPGGPWTWKLTGTFLLPGGSAGDARREHVLYAAARESGSAQWAGAPDLGVFRLDQPMIDALWALTYGDRDPGPPAGP